MSRYRLVTFDVTNTLLKFKNSVGQEYAKTALKFGIEADAHNLTRAFKKEWKVWNALQPNFGATTGLTSKEWWMEIVKRTFYSAGHKDIGDIPMTSLAGHLFEQYGTSSCWEVCPGVPDILHNLRQMGCHLGIISNFDDRLDRILTGMDLIKHFDFIVCSYKVKQRKPNPEIFDTALRMLQHLCLKKEHAVHVGDDIELDYRAAKRVGWDALLLSPYIFSGGSHPEDIVEDEVISNITEVEQKVILPDVKGACQ